MQAVEAIITIGTSFVLIALFRALTHIERRYRAAWHGAERAAGSKGTGKSGKRRLFTTHRLGRIQRFGRFLT